MTHEGDEQIAQETSPKSRLWTKIEKYIDAIGNNLGYGPKSHIFRIAKIEKSRHKEDYFDLGNGEKVVYIDGTFFLYTNTTDSEDKNIKILDVFTAKEPGSEPFLNQKKVIYDPTQQAHYIAYTFSQDINDRGGVIRSQEIPMIIIKKDKIEAKPMIEALSSIQDPIIELANSTTFCVKTSMGGKIRCQYCDIIHNQTRTEESNDDNSLLMRKM